MWVTSDGIGPLFPGRVTTHQLGYRFQSALFRLKPLPSSCSLYPRPHFLIRDYTGFRLIPADP